MNNLAIIYKATADLLPYINNAKKHSGDQVAMLAASIREFGFNNPILTDGDNGVIAGHGRLQAAQKLGLETVPTIELSHLSGAQKKAYILADNRLGEVGTEWDMELVNLELEALSELDFDLSLTGFELELGDEEPDYQCEPDEIPEISESEPVTQRGMVWLCGKHRVMCGDSTSPEDVRKLMSGKQADMVFTDPPYRMKVEGGINQPIGRAAAKLGEEIKHLCDFDPIAFLGVLPTVFENKKMNSFVFCNKDLVPDYLAWGVKCGYSFNILFWKKPNAIPLGGQWRPDVEYLLVFRKSAIWNNALSDVSYSKCLEFGRENSTPHPTMKPVDLIVNQIKISSNIDSVVLDFFGGSGSTLIACEKTSRINHSIELDEKYVDVIVKRWQQFTGKQATLENDGRTFNEIASLCP